MNLQNAQADFIDALFGTDEQATMLTPAKHISIYRNNVFASLLNALKLTYPLILALVGKDFFEMTAREYMRQYPSRSGNLEDYGEYFSDFIAHYPPVHELMYLAEVAEFEWASHSIYLAPNHPPFAAHTLASFAPEQHADLHFILNPASWLHKFHFPILHIVDLCNMQREEDIDLHKGGINLLMIRRELEISLVSLSPADFQFLQALNHHSTLSAALQQAEKIEPNYPLDEKLPQFIQDKIIVDCYLSDS